jgi:hypothetical protein
MAKEKLKKVVHASLAKSLEKQKEKRLHQILSYYNLVKKLHEIIETFPDNRIGKNLSKDFKDAALGAFALFFTQSPSFLEYQETMQKMRGQNNAKSLFGIKEFLSQNHIRDLMDGVSPIHIFPMFTYIFNGLNKFGYLDEEFRSFRNNLLVPLDGTQYFSSPTIYCENCNQKRHKNGRITYFHSVITPIIVHPDSNRVIALTPEFIIPQDGEEKQDCENAAAKRLLRNNGDWWKELGVTILGDDLYCKQPICELIKEKGLNFILTCKPDSHKTLYEYVEYQSEDIQTVEVRRWTGKRYEIDTYRFLNGVPLRDGEDGLEVNWCELIIREEKSENGKKNGKEIYKNVFVTDFKITPKNVIDIIKDGRARWKVENENNNVLKTKGYHLEHNFGHGKKNLSSLFATFNILAFLFHTVLDIVDEKYKIIRQTLPSRKTFFQDLRALTRYIYFSGWDVLMDFMIKGLKEQLHRISSSDTS